MITILHGDDEVKTHVELGKIVRAHPNVPVVRLEAKNLKLSDLENAIGTQELFSAEKVVVIDRLHSLPKSKLKDEFVEWIQTHPSDSAEVLLVENKILTPTQLKKFPGAKVNTFKLPALLFSFVDSLGLEPVAKLITMFHMVIEKAESELVFAMLVRQIRLLLCFRADGSYAGPPFGRAKIASQANRFTITRLLALHAELLAIDLAQKTSRSALTLTQEIDLWLASL